MTDYAIKGGERARAPRQNSPMKALLERGWMAICLIISLVIVLH